MKSNYREWSHGDLVDAVVGIMIDHRDNGELDEDCGFENATDEQISDSIMVMDASDLIDILESYGDIESEDENA